MAAAEGTAAPVEEVRRLAASAAAAEDAALLRLVGLLDRLPARGEADRVLEPARPRLRGLRPARPLQLARLLFAPLDGAIVPPARWRRGGHEVPRSAIAPVAAAVRAALGPLAEALEREAAGREAADDAAVAALGGRLWPAAAAALPAGGAPPAGWAEAGLAPADWAAVRAVLAPVLAAGPAIHAARRAAAARPAAAELVRAALAGPTAAGPQPLAAALATLLRGAAAPGVVAAAAAEISPAARAVAVRMVDAAIGREEAEGVAAPAAAPLGEAAAAAERLFGRVDDLDRCGLLDAAGARRVAALRRAAGEACRRRVEEGAAAEVVAPLAALRGAAEVTDAAVDAVEAAARGVRALALVAGRGTGDPAAFDRALRGPLEEVARLRAGCVPPGGEGLTAMDLARAVEILSGPEEAAALLRGGAG